MDKVQIRHVFLLLLFSHSVCEVFVMFGLMLQRSEQKALISEL